MSVTLLPELVSTKFEIAETHHAASILFTDFRAEWDDLVGMLSAFVLRKSDVIMPGGRKSPISLGIDQYFYNRNWIEHNFKIEVSADGLTTLPQHIRSTTSGTG